MDDENLSNHRDDITASDYADEKEKEIQRLKRQLEEMKRQQEEIMKMLRRFEEKKRKSQHSLTEGTSIPPKRVERKVRKVSKARERVERKTRDFESAMSDLENVIEEFVTSLLGSIATSISQGARLVLDIGEPKKKQKKQRDHWQKLWKDLSRQEIPEEDLDDFLEAMSQVAGVLNDKNRIHLLKALEREPRYHDELSQMTGLKGGQFRHHMTILKDNNLVIQERYRGRYILTPFGRSLLKLLEVLYLRYLWPHALDEDGENELEEEDIAVNNTRNDDKIKKYRRIAIEDDEIEFSDEEE